MNIPNIYEGLKVEPMEPVTVERIHLRGIIISDSWLAFIPEYWEQALRPYKRAKWKHEAGHEGTGFVPYHYEIKSGAFLVFPEFKAPQHGGFYAAHLYMIVRELHDLLKKERYQRTEGIFTEEGLEIKPCLEVDGIKTRFILKPRTLQLNDTPYHAVLSY